MYDVGYWKRLHVDPLSDPPWCTRLPGGIGSAHSEVVPA